MGVHGVVHTREIRPLADSALMCRGMEFGIVNPLRRVLCIQLLCTSEHWFVVYEAYVLSLFCKGQHGGAWIVCNASQGNGRDCA
jgi:hypothetical protein